MNAKPRAVFPSGRPWRTGDEAVHICALMLEVQNDTEDGKGPKKGFL
jgi:hypothetical protein